MDVHKQNKITKENILQIALAYRKQPIPKYLQEVLSKEKMDMDTLVLLAYNLDTQSFGGIRSVNIMILDENEKFWNLDLEYDVHTEGLIDYDIENISEIIDISKHKKGIHKTWGYLACEVLREINGNLKL